MRVPSSILPKRRGINRHRLWCRVRVRRHHHRRHMIDIRLAFDSRRVGPLHLNRLLASLIVRVAILLQARYAVRHLRASESREERPGRETAEGHHRRIEFLFGHKTKKSN